ncbi:MAG: porin [Thiobacillaceae bacterium]
MKKSLIALAVAGAFSAPAFAASSNVDIYGIMSFSVDYINTHEATGDAKDIVTARDNVSRIGFKGSEDLGGGLAAIWQVESQLTTSSGTNNLASRNTYVGLKSDSMGTVVLGRYDTPYKISTAKLDPFVDQLGDYNAIIGAAGTTTASKLFDVRADNTIAYMTPSFNGLMGAVAFIETKNVEASGLDNQQAWSAAAMYDNGPYYGSLAYEKHENIALGSSATKSNDAWKLGVGVTVADIKLGLVYENMKNSAALSATDRKAWLINAAYPMGNMLLKAEYGKADNSNAASNDGAKMFALGADYSLSKRTMVYGQYASLNNDNAGQYGLTPYAATGGVGKDVNGLSIGVKHSF